MAGAQSQAHRRTATLGHTLYRSDFTSCCLYARNSLRRRFNSDHHMMGICVDQGFGIAGDSDMTLPEQQIAAAQTRQRRQLSDGQFLHVAVARTREAGGLE